MAIPWRCSDCSSLLGEEREDRLYVKFKAMQYIVEGRDYTVIAVCRACSRLNEWRQRHDSKGQAEKRN